MFMYHNFIKWIWQHLSTQINQLVINCQNKNKSVCTYAMGFANFFIILAVVSSTYGERLHEQIYSSLEGGAACFRRLNGTHQTGCTSSEKGTVGVVQMIQNISDAQWLTLNSTAGPYVAVVSTSVFNSVVEIFMMHPSNVAGILLYEDSTEITSAFTHESRCPNEYSAGPGSQCSSSQKGGIVWNEKGTGLLRRDIPFPIFYIPESQYEEIVNISKCFERYNRDRDNQKGNALCSIQLNSFMFAAVNTAVCLRRSATSTILATTKVCDPLGDYNVYYSLFPLKQEKQPNKTISFVTARIDAASLFDGVSPGAASSVVGLVTLITAAKVLADMIPVNDSQLYDKNVLWTLFNGESFDYIGSQRVAYDLSRGMWPPGAPLTVDNIPLHVEIGQIGGALTKEDDAWPFFAFIPDVLPKANEFVTEMSQYLNQYNMNITPKITPNIPPSSLHSFRRILKNSTNSGGFEELVFTDFEETFNNMFYQSVLDDYKKISFVYHNISVDNEGTFVSTNDLLANGTMKASEVQVKIARLATALSSTLYQQVTGQPYSGNVSASAHLVDELLYCFLKSQACRLLLAADYANSGSDEAPVPDRPAPLYVSVAWNSSAAVFAGHLLALLTGVQLAGNRTNCDTQGNTHTEFSYYWLRGWNNTGVCIQTTMNFSQALSPAFTVPDYDLSSGEYSTWTESVWQSLWARVFVSAGGGGARAAALAGTGATALAVLATYWLNRHKHTVFATTPASFGNNDATAGILRTVNC